MSNDQAVAKPFMSFDIEEDGVRLYRCLWPIYLQEMMSHPIYKWCLDNNIVTLWTQANNMIFCLADDSEERCMFDVAFGDQVYQHTVDKLLGDPGISIFIYEYKLYKKSVATR